MSLLQEGEQNGEFWNEQDRLSDSARKHTTKASIAGVVTGLGVAAGALTIGTTGGLIVVAVGAAEMVHQLVASTVDIRKHELNKGKHEG